MHLLWLADLGVEQTDKRTWPPFPAAVDRQHGGWFKASRRAMQTLAQVLPRHAARGQRAAPTGSSIRKSIGEESRTNRQSAVQSRRRGGQAVALPEDVATRLLEPVHGAERDIDLLISQQPAPIGHQASPCCH